MRKFDFEEFWNGKKEIAVRCKSLEEALSFLKTAKMNGGLWESGEDLEAHTYWINKHPCIIYVPGTVAEEKRIQIGSLNDCINKRTIIDWSDYFMMEKYPELEPGMILETESGAMYMYFGSIIVSRTGSTYANYTKELRNNCGITALDVHVVYKVRTSAFLDEGNINSIFDKRFLERIWTRGTREMTLEDIEEELGYKVIIVEK